MPSVEEIFAARDNASASDPAVTEEPKRDLQTDEQEQEPKFDGKEEPELKFPAPGQRDSSSDESEGTVPRGALEAEREKRRKYTDEVADTRRILAEVQRQNAELVQALARQPQPPQQPQKPPEFDWDNPLGHVQHVVQQALAEERQRTWAAMQAQRERTEQAAAVQRHGQETMKAAWDSLVSARETDPMWEHDYRRIMTAPDQYEALAQWHKRRAFEQRVGPDFDAFVERIKAERDEELRSGGAISAPRRDAPSRPVAMPTDLSSARSVGSRSGPVWEGPRSIQDILNNR